MFSPIRDHNVLEKAVLPFPTYAEEPEVSIEFGVQITNAVSKTDTKKTRMLVAHYTPGTGGRCMSWNTIKNIKSY